MALLVGTEVEVTCLQPVALQGGEGEPLCLAYKTTTMFFGAGLYLQDNGYVLRVVGERTYYPMPAHEQLTELQEQGLLPRPLPPYSITPWQYVAGYSLWIVLAVTLVMRSLKQFYAARLRRASRGRGSTRAPDARKEGPR